MGKGSQRRPMFVSSAEYDLRWDFAHGLMTAETFQKKMKKLKQKQTKGDKR